MSLYNKLMNCFIKTYYTCSRPMTYIKALQRVFIIKLYAGMKRPNFEPLFSHCLCELKYSKV